MLGVGVSANGLDGASSDPSDGTATDLTANRQSTGNGSAQLSVDDLASGSRSSPGQSKSDLFVISVCVWFCVWDGGCASQHAT